MGMPNEQFAFFSVGTGSSYPDPVLENGLVKLAQNNFLLFDAKGKKKIIEICQNNIDSLNDPEKSASYKDFIDKLNAL